MHASHAIGEAGTRSRFWVMKVGAHSPRGRPRSVAPPQIAHVAPGAGPQLSAAGEPQKR